MDADGQPLPGLVTLERAEVRAMRLHGELGLSPASWAKLVARLGSANAEHAAASLESLKRIGRELARAAALPEGPTMGEALDVLPRWCSRTADVGLEPPPTPA